MILTIKIGFIIALLWAGWCGFRMFQTDSIKVFDTDGPVFVISRRARPLAYWSLIAAFYAALIAIAASAISL
jgi:hypothetical protein